MVQKFKIKIYQFKAKISQKIIKYNIIFFIVLDDVTAAFVNPKTLSSIFEKSPLMDIASIRSVLESVVLCSIMKLDANSMDKLFDLMIMMFKYQLTAATGPREVILLTLNHTDAMRHMIRDENAHECVSLVHQMIVDVSYISYNSTKT